MKFGAFTDFIINSLWQEWWAYLTTRCKWAHLPGGAKSPIHRGWGSPWLPRDDTEAKIPAARCASVAESYGGGVDSKLQRSEKKDERQNLISRCVRLINYDQWIKHSFCLKPIPGGIGLLQQEICHTCFGILKMKIIQGRWESVKHSASFNGPNLEAGPGCRGKDGSSGVALQWNPPLLFSGTHLFKT